MLKLIILVSLCLFMLCVNATNSSVYIMIMRINLPDTRLLVRLSPTDHLPIGWIWGHNINISDSVTAKSVKSETDPTSRERPFASMQHRSDAFVTIFVDATQSNCTISSTNRTTPLSDCTRVVT